MQDKGFNLFTGNRLEHLVRALSTVLERPLSHPFTAERVVVQSGGMARWISLELARILGIAANMNYTFPNDCVYDLLSRVCPLSDDKKPYDPRILAWNIFAWLPELAKKQEFEPIAGYLAGQGTLLKRYQLSCRIADTLDQYLLFRPDMIIRWGKGQENDWQALLWRELTGRLGDLHRVALFSSFVEEIEKMPEDELVFPERIAIFGISALPKFHMDVFYELSQFSQVNLFLLNPCREYWGDILSQHDKGREIRKHGSEDNDTLHLNQGGALLGSMGRVGRDFFDLIYTYDHHEFPLFDPPEGESMLSFLQSEIFYLSAVEDNDKKKPVVSPHDRSIEFQCCHGPLREVEVLHDRLYDMFERDPDLSPRDILVMMPDIETYAPLIHAVFGRAAEGRERIPYSVADRGFNRISRIAETFLALIDLKQSRLSVKDVFAIFESEPVRETFGLSQDDLDTLKIWVKETHIRWGLDGSHRTRFNLPGFADNTWTAGLSQMVLGYALPLKGHTVFESMAPYDAIEGQNGELLGTLLDMLEYLGDWIEISDEPVSPGEWVRRLHILLDRFFVETEENQADLRILREEINLLEERPKMANVDEDVDFSVIRYQLGQALEQRDQGYGFITGGVTFCAMLPMRSIPFAVIGMLGMQSNAYPRQTRAPGFDLIAKYPRPGDRSRRNDDRYLFLEALISARKALYISYTGRSIRDNSLVEPSVLVSELMDYLDRTFDFGDLSMHKRLVTEHPLQPFSTAYFNGENPQLFSYSKDNFRAAQRSVKHRKETEPFFKGPLLPVPEEFLDVDIMDIQAFISHPARFLLERRLGIRIDSAAPMPDSEEPFDLDGLQRYKITQWLVDQRLAKDHDEGLLAFARASGVLPVGKVGDRIFQTLDDEALMVSREVEAMCPEPSETLHDVDLTLSGIRLSGTVETVGPGLVVRHRPAMIKARDILDVWIRHLVLCASFPDKPVSGLVLGLTKPKDGERDLDMRMFCFATQARDILGNLVSLFRAGLEAPLSFFPETSFAFYKEVRENNQDPEEAFSKALRTWHGDDYLIRGEGEDPYYKLCFRGINPFNESFMDLAFQVFDPLFNHFSDPKDGGL